jgi:hypothetical protein
MKPGSIWGAILRMMENVKAGVRGNTQSWGIAYRYLLGRGELFKEVTEQYPTRFLPEPSTTCRRVPAVSWPMTCKSARAAETV